MKRIKEKIVENVNGNLRGEERVPNLTVEELQNADLNIVRYMQSTSFAAMIKTRISTSQNWNKSEENAQRSLTTEIKSRVKSWHAGGWWATEARTSE